jgi:hypothetical protein
LDPGALMGGDGAASASMAANAGIVAETRHCPSGQA